MVDAVKKPKIKSKGGKTLNKKIRKKRIKVLSPVAKALAEGEGNF
jgi:hypothetical protein